MITRKRWNRGVFVGSVLCFLQLPGAFFYNVSTQGSRGDQGGDEAPETPQ
jgi:hypothetical protein